MLHVILNIGVSNYISTSSSGNLNIGLSINTGSSLYYINVRSIFFCKVFTFKADIVIATGAPLSYSYIHTYMYIYIYIYIYPCP